MDIAGYLSEIRSLYASGQSTEHSFRPALSRLFASIDPDLTVINEPRRVAVGAPDFVFDRKGVSIGWCEAKDIGKDVRKFAANDYSKEQKARYTKGLPNLIYTNGLDFEFIRKGESIAFVTIADLIPTLPAREANFGELERLLRDFARATPISIRTAKQLAEMMAGKAAIIKDIMGKALVADLDSGQTTELTGQYEAFKANLIHDITVADFADIYAETIAYGLFAARLHDTSLDTFSRAEALELLPKTNPFLRSLFGYIAGVELDDRLRWIIDEMCDVFRAANVHDILKDFGKLSGRNDPFLHFYETFLAEYNPAKRKARGVWYTPEPVVNFIVRAVDDVLKTEFGLSMGLADTSKITIDWDTGQTDKKGKPATIKKDVHRVQILDPATGTGTFLAEVIKLVASRVQGIAPGQWSSYVENELIPRLHGFELLMASYAMCHMKLDMILTELGYKPSGQPPRLGVYLTNSLEEGEKVEQNLFAQWLANEAKQASDVKRQTPIMCVIGNPPYSYITQNTGEWINALIEDYKYVNGEHFKERKHALHDDYVKFIRFSESLIENNGEGILGFITNHGYLDNPTFRGMRWHLLNCFDEILVLDLHGNSKRGEFPPEGIKDQNVFDIQQGVAIIIAWKKRKKTKHALARVLYSELWGSREDKYSALFKLDRHNNELSEVVISPPYYTFNGKGIATSDYEDGFGILDLLQVNTTGVQTSRDPVALADDQSELCARLKEICDPHIPVETIRKRYFSQTSKKYPAGDTRDWKLVSQRKKIPINEIDSYIRPYAFRPFDRKLIAFHPDIISWPRGEVSRHMIRDNISIITARSNKKGVNHFLCSNLVSDVKCGEATTGSIFAPLYLYPEEQDLDQSVRVNFDPKLYARIRKAAGLAGPLVAPDGTDAFRKATGGARPDEVKVFDYIYGVLHSPDYRETYAEFLKIDFPRVPFPHDPATFAHVSEKGEALRRLHLMEDAAIGDTPYPFEGDGDSVVDKPRYEGGKVWINKEQGFANVPLVAWEFHIGGYQPAQKWLKDRKGRELGWDDIRHYQKIIKILAETDRIMGEIELPLDQA